MFNAKRLYGYLATGVMPEMTAIDADPVANHADGSPCYTEGCRRRGGIPWANIQKHNAKERAQMKFDFSGKGEGHRSEGKGQTTDGKLSELKRKLRFYEVDDLAKLLHETEDDPSRKEECAAVVEEINRRSGNYYDNLGERA